MKKYIFPSLIVFISVFHLTVNPAYAYTRSDYTLIPGTTVYIGAETTPKQAEAMRSIYNHLQPGIRLALSNCQIYYHAVNEDNDKVYNGSTGITRYGITTAQGDVWYGNTPLSMIRPEGKMKKDISIGGTVMTHEIGHCVDSLYLGGDLFKNGQFPASSSLEWQGLYKRYKNVISGFGGLSKSEVYNACEAFAESYAHYAMNPEKVKRDAPEIADYIDRVNANVISHFAPGSGSEILKQDIHNSASYNAYLYYSRYPDLQMAFGADGNLLWKHWIEYGLSEGRKAN